MRWLCLFLAALCTASSLGQQRLKLSSPDKRVQLQFLVQPGGISFSVRFHGRPVLEHSPLHLVLDGEDFAQGALISSVERSQRNETYPWHGVHSRATNHFNGTVIHLRRTASQFAIEARVFNDGVAFRQIFPDSGKPRVPDEATTFVLPPESTVWYHNLQGHYEAVHVRNHIADVKAGEWAAPPLTFKLPHAAGYASLTEADLRNYSGMAFQADGHRGFKIVLAHAQPPAYPFRLRYTNDIERLSHPAVITGAIQSPWRIIMLGADLNALVKNLPPVWEQTIVLPGSEIGEAAAFARRSGTTWFLAVMNSTQRRTLRVSLSFLGPGAHMALTVQDDPRDPAGLELRHGSARRGDQLNIDLAGGGGFVARFSPSE